MLKIHVARKQNFTCICKNNIIRKNNTNSYDFLVIFIQKSEILTANYFSSISMMTSLLLRSLI